MGCAAWRGGQGGNGKGHRPAPQATPFIGPERGQGRDELSDSVRRVERDTRGEVLSAERVQYDGRDMHRVKVVDDQGRVRVFMQDPQRRNDRGNDRDRGSSSSRRPPPASDDD